MAEDHGHELLVHTPTWIIASICAFFVVLSVIIERVIFFSGYLIRKHNKTSLQAAFEKIKQEFMLMGFISLALTLGQNSIESICIPSEWKRIMPMCENNSSDDEDHADNSTGSCTREGYTSLISSEGFHELHIMIFMMVIVHIIFTLLTVALGIWTVSSWKSWEERATQKEVLSVHGGARLIRQTSFVQAHARSQWRKHPITTYLFAFLRQFHNSITETDYHALRHGFIKKHMLESVVNFNFHKYILRSLEDDFKYIVGISPGLWVYAIVWLLINVDGWESHFLVSFVPAIVVLAIGTKLEHVIMSMAIEVSKNRSIVIGLPNVSPKDELFWGNRPRIFLLCIHYILFQNALEVGFDIWALFTFSQDNCLYNDRFILIIRLVVGLLVQITCGVVTLPIYSLVSQMGSTMKLSVFHVDLQSAIQRWYEEAKAKARNSQHSSRGSTNTSPPLVLDIPEVSA